MMSKKLISILLILVNTLLFAQEKKFQLNLRKDYSKIIKTITPKSSLRNTKSIIVDSSFAIIDTSYFHFFKNFKAFNNNIHNYHKDHAFNSININLKHFKVPVVIFFDRGFSKNQINNFKKFVLSFPKIENLEISFTKDIEKANYFFDIVNYNVSAYKKEQIEEYETYADKSKLTFLNMAFTNLQDLNNKLISCHYLINESILNDSDFLSKLKKGFYISLARLNPKPIAPNQSILGLGFNENNILSSYDGQMLKFHYELMYDFKINIETFEFLSEIYLKK